jgi:hypothetical protein
MKKLAFLMVFAALGAAGCFYDSEEDLYPSNCEITNVSYANQIVPILSAQCLGCHSTAANLGSVRLEGYDAVKIWVNNGRLIGAVRHDAGFSPMPKNAGKISPCSIAQIESWIQAGAPNN